ncbi:hypothetical protein L6V77_08235 [Myxococcota bacterium]|nr:hypothetical protein [Myxococcota bacterium]
MQTERRRRRSASPSEALGLYFESLAARHAWEAVALADDDGLLLGGAGKNVDQEGIAAIAPVAAREPEHAPEGLLGLVTRGRPLRVWGVTLDGQTFHLATVGATTAPPAETYSALGRILGAPCAASV